jgi:Na+-translocating ferredoxin:NAD+ oxidoreductase subunit C
MIFYKIKGLHIDGRKEMSKKEPIKDYFDPKFVYIPLLQQASNLKALVEVGDEVKLGQPVAKREGFGELEIHASVSGKVTAMKKVWHSSGRMVNAIEIENDFKKTKHESIQPENNVNDLTREDLIKKMKDSGLVGLGGAGFPSYVKFQTKDQIDTVIINAVECEPYLTCDYTFVTKYPEKLLKGLTYLMKAADAKNGIVAFKRYNKGIKKALKEYLDKYPNITLYEMADVYPAGWEKYIIEKVLKKTYSRLPSEAGVIVDNASSAVIYADAVEENMPLVSRPITITGEGINNPMNFHVPIGTKVSELIEMSGGYIDGLDPMKANYIAGGPMTGRAILIDDLIVSDTLGGVIVKPIVEDNNPACLGCGQCSDVCPVYLAPTEIKRALDLKNPDIIKALGADKCIQCGLCSYVCPSHIEITDYVGKAKDFLRKGAK